MPELRQVRTLRLAAPRREQVARSAIALEDALRTASLPRLPKGAIVLVRRLDLGQFPAGASPQWLSRHIEARLQALQLAAPVDPRHDAPAAAPAVWFADRCEALAALLAASLRAAPRAWYWAGVLPGWRPGMTTREILPRALRQAESEPAAAAAAAGVAALLQALLRLDRLDAVLEHLDAGHVAPIANPNVITAEPRAHVPEPQAAAGARPAARPVAASDVAASAPAPDPSEVPNLMIASAAWRAALARWLRRWGAADRRSRWLAAHALIAVHGPAAAAHADPLIRRLTAAMATARPAAPAAGRTRPSPASASSTPDRAVQRLAAGGADGPERVPAAENSGAKASDLPPPKPENLPPAEPDWQPSRHGGLLLLLPALARLEIAAADREGDLCLHLLHRIADRLKIRKDDAIRQALPKPLPHTGPRPFVPPATWQDLSRLPRGVDPGRADGLLVACQLVLARFLRRNARISLRRLVRRPALVHATPTHIDLRFAARWVELEVRLAGLDLDPGWVPWLGRVVSFHYDYEGRP
jgi:hypothetical protein